LGHWTLLAFDVGQGGAVLLQTQTHHVLFDTGPRQGASDAGTRTLAPALRALGIRKLDSVVVSHADNDHAGGLLAVLKALPVGMLYSSFSFEEWLRRALHASAAQSLKTESLQAHPCEHGHRWDWDGVRFEFLHPAARKPAAVPTPAVPIASPNAFSARDRQLTTQTEPVNTVSVRSNKSRPSKNAQSCVLHVQGSHHSALLPGDIGVKQEQLLLERHSAEQRAPVQHALAQPVLAQRQAVHTTQATPAALTADLVVVAHHGSETSSSPRFVQQLGAQHAIVQTGYLNRFGHPHPVIKQRWVEAKATFWQTDRHGAILASSTPAGLSVQPYSQLRQRYWHQRLP
jgi:competence protein ComEC